MSVVQPTREQIAALVAALPRVQYLAGVFYEYDRNQQDEFKHASLDPDTGYLPALEAVAALAGRERRLREMLEQFTEHDGFDTDRGYCIWKVLCLGSELGGTPHDPDCLWTQARALLAEAQEEKR